MNLILGLNLFLDLFNQFPAPEYRQSRQHYFSHPCIGHLCDVPSEIDF